jgi:hypothetical protein
VLAFGLVRGLALVEGTLHEPIALLPSALLPLVLLGAESLLLFAGTRLVLDSALADGWLKPFGALSQQSMQQQSARYSITEQSLQILVDQTAEYDRRLTKSYS